MPNFVMIQTNILLINGKIGWKYLWYFLKDGQKNFT